ncbi:MAG: MFS transporter [Kiritimatiellales bacterium]
MFKRQCCGRDLPVHMGTCRAAPEDRIPMREKLFYGSGIVAFQICNNAIPQLAYPIYNILLGVPAAWVGWVLMAGRIWDSFTDPVMGSISDNARTRWGRRKPFILAGALFSSLLYVMVWMVPRSFGPVATTVYFLISALLFFTAFTVFAVPYTSQGFELTPDSHERTRLMSVRAYFATLTGLVIPWIFAIAQWDVFESPLDGVRFLAVVVGILIIISVLPTLFVSERFENRAAQQQKVSLFWGISETVKNRAFQSLIGLTVATQLTMLIAGSLGLYVIIYYVFSGDVKMGAVYSGYNGTVFTVSGLVAIPIVTRLARRFGKVKVMGGIAALSILASCLQWVCYIPANPEFMFFPTALLGPTSAGFWILVNSMKADVPDDDELRTGLRREGMFGAMATWIQKFAMAFSFILTGIILDVTGFHADAESQADSTVFGMRLAFVLIPAIGGVLSLLILRFYPLNEQRLSEIRSALEQRRGVL